MRLEIVMAGPRQSKPESMSAGLKGARILIVEARYYEDIADELLSGAVAALDDAGASHQWSSPATYAG